MTIRADPMRARAADVDALASSLRRGGNALEDVPALLAKVLAGDSWREFVTQRGELVRHERVEEFVTTPPLRGLGATVALVERVMGTDDPDLLRLWRAARKGRPGRPKKGTKKPLESHGVSRGTSAHDADRLARDAPDEYEAVRRGEKTINAAARDAGIRPHRISVRLDRPESIARSLRAHMKPDDVTTLARLLQEG